MRVRDLTSVAVLTVLWLGSDAAVGRAQNPFTVPPCVLTLDIKSVINGTRFQPQGKYSVPSNQAGKPWQIVIDFGTIADGEFTEFQKGETIALTIVNGSLTSWKQSNVTTLNPNPPQDLHMRARLQKDVALPGLHDWQTGDVDYIPLKTANDRPIDPEES